ncbi:hypothetical protein ACVIGB_000965 [Bradyrhizobium sp. USDA 4341]
MRKNTLFTLMAAAITLANLSAPAKANDAWFPGLVAGAAPGAMIGATGPYGPVYYRERYTYPYAPYAYGEGYRGYLGEDRGYRQVPYGYSLASPSYYDETCRVVREPTPFGWRRLRICE